MDILDGLLQTACSHGSDSSGPQSDAACDTVDAHRLMTDWVQFVRSRV